MFRWVTDVERGEWVRERLGPFGSAVGSVVPRGFAAYARVLHRVQVSGDAWVRWADVAAATGATLHPTAQWWKVARRPDWHAGAPLVGHDEPWPDGYDPVRHVGARRGAPGEWRSGDPREGELDAGQLDALAGVLGGWTDPDRITAAFWNGSSWEGGQVLTAFTARRGPLWRAGPVRRLAVARHLRRARRLVHDLPTGADIAPAVLAGPRLQLPAREHLLLAGSLGDVAALASGTATADVEPFRPGTRTPSLLWPDDRSWCVATEVDFDSTLVGGPRALIELVLADPVLEAFEVSQDDSLGAYDDAVNR